MLSAKFHSYLVVAVVLSLQFLMGATVYQTFMAFFIDLFTILITDSAFPLAWLWYEEQVLCLNSHFLQSLNIRQLGIVDRYLR